MMPAIFWSKVARARESGQSVGINSIHTRHSLTPIAAYRNALAAFSC